jgi:hypothetical protein
MAQGGTTTSHTAVYPSSTLRPVPSFVFEVPAGFELDEGPGALAVARVPEAVDGFWVNLIVSHDRVQRGMGLKTAAKNTFGLLARQCPGLALSEQRTGRFGDRLTFLAVANFAAPRTKRPLSQVHAIFFAAPEEEATKTADLFHIVGTCPAELVKKYGPAFVQVISSFQFT